MISVDEKQKTVFPPLNWTSLRKRYTVARARGRVRSRSMLLVEGSSG